VDPCANNGGCNVNATCAQAGTGRTCICKSGFSGDGQSCTDVNECQTNNGGCHTNATCTNTTGSRTCACKSGFTGNGTSCTDVNECQSANGGCDTNAICTNTSGSRTCACSEGFSGNGLTCTLVPPPTAVSIWKFEKQSTATRIVDSRGSNTGTVVTGNELVSPPAATAPVFAADRNGVANGALRLDGVTSQNWVSVPHSTSLNSPWVNNAITMTIWVRLLSVPASGGIGLFDRGGNQDTTTFSLWIFNGKPQLRMDNYTASGAANMPVNSWTFLAGVYNGTALTLYVNGEVAGSFGNVGVPLVSLSGQLTIGALQNTTSGYPTGFPNGDIDEVRLYGAALSAPQIRVVMEE